MTTKPDLVGPWRAYALLEEGRLIRPVPQGGDVALPWMSKETQWHIHSYYVYEWKHACDVDTEAATKSPSDNSMDWVETLAFLDDIREPTVISDDVLMRRGPDRTLQTKLGTQVTWQPMSLSVAELRMASAKRWVPYEPTVQISVTPWEAGRLNWEHGKMVRVCVPGSIWTPWHEPLTLVRIDVENAHEALLTPKEIKQYGIKT